MQHIIIDNKDTKLYPNNPFMVKHSLEHNPLFEIERLIELCRFLPSDYIEYNSGTLPVYLNPNDTPMNGLSATETLQRIKECQSWLVLKNVQQDNAYKTLLDNCLNETEKQLGLKNTDLRREAFIFVSSPHSITPFHIDPEHNFLLQIKGTKTIKQWSAFDDDILPQDVLEEKFYSKNIPHRNISYKDEFENKAQNFHLQPNEGVYVPVHAPHWVKNGPDVSISFSITYRSKRSQRSARLYRLNGILRSKGFNPYPVDRNQSIDLVKDYSYHLASKTLKILRKVV